MITNYSMPLLNGFSFHGPSWNNYAPNGNIPMVMLHIRRRFNVFNGPIVIFLLRIIVVENICLVNSIWTFLRQPEEYKPSEKKSRTFSPHHGILFFAVYLNARFLAGNMHTHNKLNSSILCVLTGKNQRLFFPTPKSFTYTNVSFQNIFCIEI